jgi:cysteine-rich repeat protein
MHNKFSKIFTVSCFGIALVLAGIQLSMKAPETRAAAVNVSLTVSDAVCGNHIFESAFEQCDDGNLLNGDGCDSLCHIEVCGNGLIQSPEQCDDNNAAAGDGCSATCQIETGWECSGIPSVCHFSCGDTTIDSGEQCDDGNLVNGDGCDNECYTEVCGNGRIQSGEVCDDGNAVSGDGCSTLCAVEPGFVCHGAPSCCSLCGDNTIQCAEQCDNGKQCTNRTNCTVDGQCLGIGDGVCAVRANDGCSLSCTVEGGSRPPATDVIISQITAYPESRSGSAGTNYDSRYTFSVLSPDNQNHQSYYSSPALLSTNNTGIGFPYVTLGGVSAGTYDITIKTPSHLTQMLDNVYLQAGENLINFTNPANLVQIGSQVMIAGDINGFGVSPTTLGDDVINSVDISIVLQNLGVSDSSGNNIRANLNQDTVVDEGDLNILLNNLDKESNF